MGVVIDGVYYGNPDRPEPVVEAPKPRGKIVAKVEPKQDDDGFPSP